MKEEELELIIAETGSFLRRLAEHKMAALVLMVGTEDSQPISCCNFTNELSERIEFLQAYLEVLKSAEKENNYAVRNAPSVQ